jgi:hypothetical protein
MRTALVAFLFSVAALADPPEPGPLPLLKAACRPLCEGLTARETAHALGKLTVDHGEAAQVEIKLNDPLFPEAEVIRDGTSRRPVAVRLYVKDDRKLLVSVLTSALGKLEETRRRLLNGSLNVVFEKSVDGSADCACRISAEVSAEKQIENAQVALVTVSRGER